MATDQARVRGTEWFDLTDANGLANWNWIADALALVAVGLISDRLRVRKPFMLVGAETVGVGPRRPVIFECVGVPGLLDQVITSAPVYSRIVVVEVCMVPDTIRPVLATSKEIDLRFVVGYTPPEFRDTLHLLADGKVDATPTLTGTAGLAGVDTAFAALADPQRHAKILIDPTSTTADIT